MIEIGPNLMEVLKALVLMLMVVGCMWAFFK